jgi:hypothetical protein
MIDTVIKLPTTRLPKFQNVWTKLQVWFEIVGYSRAAAHLASNGHTEEAKACMKQLEMLRS